MNRRVFQGHHSRIQRSSEAILSEVLYEHWLENCRASRGATPEYKWLCPALDAGFFICGSG
jgi:hypothetical protein